MKHTELKRIGLALLLAVGLTTAGYAETNFPQIEMREAYALKLEISFLDKGYDTKVETTDLWGTSLRIRGVVMSRVVAHHLMKDEEFVRTLHDLEFQKVIFTDGRDRWEWKIN